jgi:hypothetical protein
LEQDFSQSRRHPRYKSPGIEVTKSQDQSHPMVSQVWTRHLAVAAGTRARFHPMLIQPAGGPLIPVAGQGGVLAFSTMR